VLGALGELREATRLLPNPQETCRSFSVFYEAVKRQSRSLQSQLNGELF
jgi:iron-sulfur cluster repair protein YtfE (RIC family)